MKLPKFLRFGRKSRNAPAMLTKSYFPLGGFVDFLVSYGHTDLAAYAAIALYCKTSPLWSAVDIICQEVASLAPVVKEMKSDGIAGDHPVLELLESPNADSGLWEFLYFAAAFYLITGNSYLSATGDVNKPPLELRPVYPQAVNAIPNSWDGRASVFSLQANSATLDFKRTEIGKRWRFYYKDEAEFWQIKRFNPIQGELYGQTPISSILPEIDWFNAASVHNVSLLKRGARPSGILMNNTARGKVTGEPLTDDQFQRLKEQLGRFQGEANAGKPMFFEGPWLEWKDLLTSNRDMDFTEGRRNVRKAIYTQYRIPLPLIEGERQTFSNMESANDQLYDAAVLPAADRIFGELNLLLMPRYKDRGKLLLTYDESRIPALKRRKTGEVKEKSETGIYTINELRTIAGMEALDEGGDMLYRPASMVPVSQDQYTDDQFSEPQKTSKKDFRRILLRKGYSEEKIEEMASVLRLK